VFPRPKIVFAASRKTLLSSGQNDRMGFENSDE
jgi:hypothetical protein